MGVAGSALGDAGSSTPSAGAPSLAGAGGKGVALGGNTGSAGSGEIAGSSSLAGLGANGGGGGSDRGGSVGGGALDACVGKFCEDFESGALDPAIWSVQAN